MIVLFQFFDSKLNCVYAVPTATETTKSNQVRYYTSDACVVLRSHMDLFFFFHLILFHVCDDGLCWARDLFDHLINACSLTNAIHTFIDTYMYICIYVYTYISHIFSQQTLCSECRFVFVLCVSFSSIYSDCYFPFQCKSATTATRNRKGHTNPYAILSFSFSFGFWYEIVDIAIVVHIWNSEAFSSLPSVLFPPLSCHANVLLSFVLIRFRCAPNVYLYMCG